MLPRQKGSQFHSKREDPATYCGRPPKRSGSLALVVSGGGSGTKPSALRLFLGFDLNDEVYVVPDRAQIGLHAEIRAFESTAGGKTSRVNLVEGILTNFVYDDVERNWFSHAM
jgi:hypothetical protein